ncbi:MAG: tetratricopeptide repeat protein [Deltaproteobacteria bacterium]|nr:tetratricopeptide repeat protein [Deltaproteobacteria bacterium]
MFRLRLALTLCVALFAGLLACEKVYDPDFWWHLATGDWIWAHRAAPRVDPFGFATLGAPWVAHSWAADAILSAWYARLGIEGVVLGKAGLVAIGFGLAHTLTVRLGASAASAALTLVAAAIAARFQFRERPLIVAFVFLPLFVFGLEKLRRGDRRWFAGLLLAMVAWANMHGSFFLGLVLAGAMCLEDAVESRPLRFSAGFFGAAVAATLVNPAGPALLGQILSDFSAFSVTRAVPIQEYEPLVLAEHKLFVGLAALTLVALVVPYRRFRFFSLVIFLVANVLAFRSVRFVALAALLNAMVLSIQLEPWLEAARQRAKTWARLASPVFFASTLTLAGGAFASALRQGREAQFGVGVNEARFPGAAVRFLKSVGVAGNLFNTWELGGYLLHELPNVKPLMDGRCLDAQLELQARLGAMDAAGLEHFVEEHDVQGAILSRTDNFADFFAISPRYQRVFFDDRAVVYLTRARAEQAAAEGVPMMRFLRPESYDYQYLAALAAGPNAAEVESELRRAVEASPTSFTPRFLLGFFLESQGRPEALDHYEAAVQRNPSFAFTHYQLGARAAKVALSAGQGPRAVGILRAAIQAREPSEDLGLLLGTALQQSGDLVGAERELRAVLASDPHRLEAVVNLGFLLVDSAKPKEAVPLFQRASDENPQDPNALYGLAFSLQAAGDTEGAITAWRRFVYTYPDNPWTPKAWSFLHDLKCFK